MRHLELARCSNQRPRRATRSRLSAPAEAALARATGTYNAPKGPEGASIGWTRAVEVPATARGARSRCDDSRVAALAAGSVHTGAPLPAAYEPPAREA